MKLNDYQDATDSTAIYPTDVTVDLIKESGGLEFVPLYPFFGIGEEAGEVLGKMKKAIRDGHTYEQVQANVKAELGDVLWYVARLAKEMGLSLEDVAEANLDKLNSRKERDVLGGSGDHR